MKPIWYLPFFVSVVSCSTYPVSSGLLSPKNTASLPQYHMQAIVESQFEFSQDQTLLTARLKEDTGLMTRYETLRKPVTATQVQAETVVLTSEGQEKERRKTTPPEAKLVLKVAASNGLATIYKELKQRYQLAGLVE